MRKFIIALLTCSSLIVPAAADAASRPAYEREYLAHYDQLRARHGVDAPGCNLLVNRYHNRCAGKATAARVKRSNITLKRMLYVPKPAAKAPATATVTASTITASSYHAPSVTTPTTSSGGGSCGGGYRGLYQFDCQTWRSVGGTGDPAAASPAEQRARAEVLLRQRGTSPWPNCGSTDLDAVAQCESGGNPHAVG